MPGDVRVLDLGRIKIVKIVNHRHLPTALAQQTVDQMRANKSRPAGYKNIFHSTFIIKRFVRECKNLRFACKS